MDALFQAITQSVTSGGALGGAFLAMCALNLILLRRLFAIEDKLIEALNKNNLAFERLIDRLDDRPCLTTQNRNNQ